MLRLVSCLLVFLFLVPAAAWSQSRIDCSAIQSAVLKQTVHYCVLLPPGYDSKRSKSVNRRYPVLYFLHGLGDDEQTLFRTGGWTMIDDLRQEYKIGEFLIVAPEGKRSFYINSADGKVLYADFFLHEFIPQIESKYHIRSGREGRAISGLSMGGYGALHFAFAHPELFSAVSAQSAALITQSPHDLNTAEQSHSPLSGMLAKVFGRPIDVRHWNENDPLVLAKVNQSRLNDLAIYFNCGDEDNYGFDDGAKLLHKELIDEGIKHEYHLYPGNHGPGYFLAHLAETMQFHSRVFEAQKSGVSRATAGSSSR
jgi:S-formylglutathione hydrolase FrmB